MKRKRLRALSIPLVVTIAMASYLSGVYSGRFTDQPVLFKDAVAAETKSLASPVKAISERDVYYPGTEDLAPDEMRVIACGTGMPTVRPKQAAACWLVELGNGDKFLFDIGDQSMSRLSAMKIPWDYLDKVFIGHLHLDHMADLPSLWISGLKSNRTYPLRVWGPSSSKPELGTKASIDHMCYVPP